VPTPSYTAGLTTISDRNLSAFSAGIAWWWNPNPSKCRARGVVCDKTSGYIDWRIDTAVAAGQNRSGRTLVEVMGRIE